VTIREHIGPALRMTFLTLLLTGIAYPLLATALSQAIFPRQANGSLVKDDAGRVVGSELIGQPFNSPSYFQPRPSAAGDKGWDPTSSGGSNLGPTSKKLRERAAADAERLLKENPAAPQPIPAELVAASGSGLDPHLSPQAAEWQIARVAAARQVSADRIRAVVQDAVEGRDLGFLGEPRVNVLLLNLSLDRKFGKPVTAAK
jgi:K+-transporting ATPase ATPase C chain